MTKKAWPLLIFLCGNIASAASKPAPVLNPRAQAKAAAIKQQWKNLAAQPLSPHGIPFEKGSTFWVKLTAKGLPKEGLTSSSPVGQQFFGIAAGFVVHDRCLVANGSHVYGEVLESRPFQENPFIPAHLKLFFYKLEDATEKKPVPIEAVVAQVEGLDVSSGGTLLGYKDIRLEDGDWISVKLLKTVALNLQKQVRGIGVWGDWTNGQFRLTRVDRGSSAADQKLDIGDAVVEMDGKKLDKNSPWDLLYGEPDSSLSLRVLKAGKGKPVKVKCVRGVHIWEGLGMRFKKSSKGFKIVRIIPDSPVDRKKIPLESLIMGVNNRDLSGLSKAEFEKLLPKRTGGKITISYLPPGSNKPVSVELTAAKVTEVIH